MGAEIAIVTAICEHDDERLAGRRHSAQPVHVMRYILRAPIDGYIPRSEPNVLVLRVCLRRQSVRVKDGADTEQTRTGTVSQGERVKG